VELEEFKTSLKKLNISAKDFSDLVNIPYSTVAKYGSQNPVPAWVQPFLNLYSRSKDMEEARKIIIEVAEKIKN